jgi:hypothetical protein
MNRQQNRKAFRMLHPSENMQAMRDVTEAIKIGDSGRAAGNDAGLANAQDDPENNEILLAACRIVIGGYKAEISRGQRDSLFVQAAYQLLHHFLEQQFASHSRAA